MTEGRPDLERLQQALLRLGEELGEPSADDLPARVRDRLEKGAPPPRVRSSLRHYRPLRRAVVLAAAIVAVLVAAAFGASLAVGGVRILFGSQSTLSPAPLGGSLDLGQRVTLTEARAAVPFRVVVPSLPDLRSPNEVYLGRLVPGGQVSLLYESRPGLPPAFGTRVGLLISQFRSPHRIVVVQPLDLAMLGANDRLGIGQRGQGLVAVSWQQQALQVVTQSTALRRLLSSGSKCWA